MSTEQDAAQGLHHQPESQEKTRGFLTLLYVTVLTFATLYSPQPLLSTIQGSYPGLSDATVALLMTVALIPLSIAPLIYGSFLSSLDTRRVLQCCMVLMALAGVGLWYCRSFTGLLGFRLVQGLVIPAVLTCLMAHISAKFQGAQLQRALAVYIGVTILGGLVGRTMSGLVATLVGWRYIFLCIALAQLLALIPLGRLESRAQGHFARVRLSEFWAIARTPGLGNLMLIDACGFFVFAGIASYLPFHLAENGNGMSEWRISLMYLGYGVGILMAFSSRRIIAKVGGEARAIALGMAVYLCSMPGFLLGQTSIIFLTMCLICVGQFLEHSISPGVINRMADRDKGAVNGLYLSVYYMGGALGSYAPGLIYGLWGWQVFITVLASVLLIALAATHGLQKHIPKG